jgi:Capsular polysaccharide synthesis protein
MPLRLNSNTTTTNTHDQRPAMETQSYHIPSGLHQIPSHLLDLRSDAEVDEDLLSSHAVTNEKNVWFFWHTGFQHMHAYTQRNVRAWHRRLTKHGWRIRVLDRQPGSPLNIANFLDISDPATFPKAFIDNTLDGKFALQHTSDLVRFPLLLKYGGVYADVGLLMIGDLDRLWSETIGNPESRFEVLSFNEGVDGRGLFNYFLCSGRNNAFFSRCHRLLLELWAADGGKTSTEGMHSSPLLKGIPNMGGGGFTIKEKDRIIGPEETGRMLSDYIIQGQVITMVMELIDEEDGWNGPQYVVDNIYAINFMEGSQLINQFTNWDGRKAFDLMSLPLPKDGEPESPEQKEARDIVEGCLQRSFVFKLAHGLILKVFEATLGSCWRDNPGSDDVPGTYAHWLRYAMIYWNQDNLPPTLDFKVKPPVKRGPLLRPE